MINFPTSLTLSLTSHFEAIFQQLRGYSAELWGLTAAPAAPAALAAEAPVHGFEAGYDGPKELKLGHPNRNDKNVRVSNFCLESGTALSSTQSWMCR